MSLSSNLIDILDQLPILPLIQIVKNIDNFHDLVKLSFKSDKWRWAVDSQEMNGGNISFNIKESHCEVTTADCSNGDYRTFFLVSKDNLDIQGDNVIRIDDNCYYQNAMRGLHYVYTRVPSIFVPCLEIFDASLMTVSDLLRIDCNEATIGANCWKTEDLRMFLFHWSKGKSRYGAQHFTFQMSQEQVEELDIKEAVKDVNAAPWNPKDRDQKLLTFSEGIYGTIDLADGLDFRLPKGKLATIYLDPETRILHICRWYLVFEMEQVEDLMMIWLAHYNQILATDDLTPKQRLSYEEMREKSLQTVRNIRNDQNFDFTDVGEVE